MEQYRKMLISMARLNPYIADYDFPFVIQILEKFDSVIPLNKVLSEFSYPLYTRLRSSGLIKGKDEKRDDRNIKLMEQAIYKEHVELTSGMQIQENSPDIISLEIEESKKMLTTPPTSWNTGDLPMAEELFNDKLLNEEKPIENIYRKEQKPFLQLNGEHKAEPVKTMSYDRMMNFIRIDDTRSRQFHLHRVNHKQMGIDWADNK